MLYKKGAYFRKIRLGNAFVKDTNKINKGYSVPGDRAARFPPWEGMKVL
jgi:hypothetical protein